MIRVMVSSLAKILGVVLAFMVLAASSVKFDQPVVQSQQPGPYRNYLPVVSRMLVQSGPEIYTVSFYMSTVDPTNLYNRGCDLGTRDKNLPGIQDNVVILDFGGPRYLGNGIYGARLFNTAYVSTTQIATAVQNFGLGYYVCTGDDHLSSLIIGIGTNNYIWPGCVDDNTCHIYQVNYAHGRAWAQMVNSVNSHFRSQGLSGQVGAVGANDIELGWNTYAASNDWLNGYDSANEYEMINFGAIPGCPYFASPGAQCGSSGYLWSKEQVWQVIWGSPPVYPLPEIYANSGVNAQQWYLMSVYAYQTHGLAIEFRGVMTQSLSCIDRPEPSCSVIGNTPQQGWTQLNALVNGDPRTAHPIKWSTDIAWNWWKYANLP